MYVESIIEARSCNHCCSRRATSIAYCMRERESVCVCVCVPHCNMWRALLYNIISHYLTNGTILGFSKKKVIDHKMCFDFLYNFCLKHFLF